MSIRLPGCVCGLVCAFVVMAAAGPARAVISYDNANGITTQPSDDIRWNSVGNWLEAGGVAIAPNYFLATQHQGLTTNTFVLTTTVGGSTTTTDYFSNTYYLIPNTDLAVWKTQSTFPSTSIAPLYSGAAGSEVGQTATFVSYGFDQQGTPVTSTVNSNTVQNGWLWGSNSGKSFGQGTINAISNSGPDNAPTLMTSFAPVSGQNEGIFAAGDSGGGVFIYNDGEYQLAGIVYGIDQYYTAPNSGSAINAAIYNSTGLYVSDGVNYYDAATYDNGEYLEQNGYASEIAPYISQIDAITGVPEPGSLTLIVGSGMMLMRRRRRR